MTEQDLAMQAGNIARKKAETAGRNYRLDHPYADGATARKTASNLYTDQDLRNQFVTGWYLEQWRRH